MKKLFDQLSERCSRATTNSYSTSFSSAVNMLGEGIRQDIHNIYGFVRVADEIVDSFHDYDKKALFDKFESDYRHALKMGISTNPILNAFQKTVRQYDIDIELIEAFMRSMKADLDKAIYNNKAEIDEYIYGSADVVGLMCLKVFVNGDEETYQRLKPSAMKLGSAFQKVNFLRDLKSDQELLNRTYFPGVNLKNLDQEKKNQIIQEIEDDFTMALEGIKQLPSSSKFGVYTAYVYYLQLLKKLKKTPSTKITELRIRVNDWTKASLLAKSYVGVKLNIV